MISEAIVTKYDINSIQIECKNDRPGILILAESNAPGWKAYIDGQKTEILEANYWQKGIVVPEGEHKIRFIYCPDAFVLGIIISCITASSIIGFFVWRLCQGLKLLQNRSEGNRK